MTGFACLRNRKQLQHEAVQVTLLQARDRQLPLGKKKLCDHLLAEGLSREHGKCFLVLLRWKNP